ncbi:MAG: prolyl oligopeptidase family serine peptidase [Phycisphaerae bacterium]|nr:prolyl oligopeptidase family serine peptidase [Phycisphaerae bacterium]
MNLRLLPLAIVWFCSILSGSTALANDADATGSQRFEKAVYKHAAPAIELPYRLLKPDAGAKPTPTGKDVADKALAAKPPADKPTGDKPEAEKLATESAPAAPAKFPLIVFLHGDNQCGNDNEAQLRGCGEFGQAKLREKYPCFVLAPQCPKGQSWASAPVNPAPWRQAAEPTAPLAAALALAEKMIAEQPIDPDRVYLLGAEMGGFGAWEMLARKPELFAAAIPVAGDADSRKVRAYKKVPVWVFHGARDPEVSISRVRSHLSELRKVNPDVEFTEFEDKAHAILPKVMAHKELLPWLFEQKRGAKP